MLGLVSFVVVNGAPIAEFVGQLNWPTLSAAVLPISVAAVLVLLGNLVRTLRTKVLLDNAKQGATFAQFRVLAAGSFFNVMLPFRVGELVRAYLLARQLRISLLYTLTSIVVERLLDVALVAALLLLFVAVANVGLSGLALAAITVLVVSLTVMVLFILVLRENSLLMKIVWRGTSILSAAGERRFRMSIWSVVHGYQQLMRDKSNLVRYLFYFLLSWALYLGALVLVFATVFPGAVSYPALGALAPFLVPDALFSLQSFQGYVETLSSFYVSAGIVELGAQAIVIAGTVWAVLNIPIAIFGFVSLLGRQLTTRAHPFPTDDTRSKNLDRTLHRGEALSAFLDSFFRRDGLAQALHQLDVKGEIDLVRFFKGGSDAVTALISDDSGVKVRKIVPLKYQSKLQQQHDWLHRHGHVEQIVRVLDEHVREDYYSIDLSYDPKTISMFTYVHTNSLLASQAALQHAWDTMFVGVYSLSPAAQYDQIRDEYVADRLESRVDAASAGHEELRMVLACEELNIAGVAQLNYRQVLDAIKNHPLAWAELGHFQTSGAIHGDFTIDNILIDPATKASLIIDPSDDNQIRGPVLDFARHFQSLWGGYEFLNEDASAPNVEISDDGRTASVEYMSVRSARYEELAQWTWLLAEERLTPEELRSLPFHVGLLYGRMLTHRIAIDPHTALVYYTKCVEFLNQFYRQYEPVRQEGPQ